MVVFLADSLRADRLGCYGHTRDTSPALDALAASGYLFERCYAPATWTKPSIASLFTGVMPSVHRAGYAGGWKRSVSTGRVQRLRPCFKTLAEHLQEAGYQTAWSLANSLVLDKFGFGQGMSYYEECLEMTTEQHIISVVRWLNDSAREPFFLMIHTIDPHCPYVPAQEDALSCLGMTAEEFLDTVPEPDRTFLLLYYLRKGQLFNLPYQASTSFEPLRRTGIAALAALYDAEICGVDSQFRRLHAALENKGFLDHTVLVATSDHGEAFGEHGLFYHAKEPYEHQIRVPLLIRLPGQTQPARARAPVSLYDLFPTLLSLAGVSTPAYVEGSSLLDAAGAVIAADGRPIFAEYDGANPDPESWGGPMVLDTLKVADLKTCGGLHVFDLESDPAETVNLLDSERGQQRDIQEAIDLYFERRAARIDVSRAFGEPEWMEPLEEDAAAMEALGYL